MSERFDDFMRRLLKTKSMTDIAALSMERNLQRDLTDPLAFPEGKSLSVIRPLTAFSRVTLKVDIDIPVTLKVGDKVFCSGRDLLSQLFLVYRGNIAAFTKDRVTENYQNLLLPTHPLINFICSFICQNLVGLKIYKSILRKTMLRSVFTLTHPSSGTR